MALVDYSVTSLGLWYGVVCCWCHLTSSPDHVTFYQQFMASCKKNMLICSLSVFIVSTTDCGCLIKHQTLASSGISSQKCLNISEFSFCAYFKSTCSCIQFPCPWDIGMLHRFPTHMSITVTYLYSNHPMLLAYVLLSIMALFKSYPTISDITVPLALLCMWSHLFRCELLLHDKAVTLWEWCTFLHNCLIVYFS